MPALRPRSQRPLLVPEVVQTSGMDCGPAALKSLLEGLGFSLHYGRLRDACQTSVDGTSIDMLEALCLQLGFEASQIVVPLDHLLLPGADSFPAILVTRIASGAPHFVVLWNRLAGLVQLMDPATGRRWVAPRRLMDEVYVHTLPVTASLWRKLALDADFAGGLRYRLGHLGMAEATAAELIQRASASPSCLPLAALDAAARMVAAASGPAATRGFAARRVMDLWEQATAEGAVATQVIAPVYWSARPLPPQEEGGEELVRLSGAVLLRVRPRSAEAPAADASPGSDAAPAAGPLSPELARALTEPTSGPERPVIDFLRAEGPSALVAMVLALLLSAGGLAVQALFFRVLLDVTSLLGSPHARAGAVATVLVLMVALLAVEWPVASSLKRLGRGLELRFRVALFRALSRLTDRYFSSRLSSDMGHRGHQIHLVRTLPELVGRVVRDLSELLIISAALVWMAPALAVPVLAATGMALAIPLVLRSTLRQADLRVRTQSGAMSRFYLDAFLGLMPIRTHGAERSVRREQERLLVGWARASEGLLSLTLATETIQALQGVAIAVVLLMSYLEAAPEASANVLLVAYWALRVPSLGQSLMAGLRDYPMYRNVMLRLLEPLGAATDSTRPEAPAPEPGSGGMGIELRGVSVQALGHVLLTDVNLSIEPGTHVAVVGPSGAGKSTLAHLLLGLHPPASGELRMEGRPVDEDSLRHLHPSMAWVDPTVHLWNQSLLANLSYGAPAATPGLGELLHQAELVPLLERLPEGLQTPLGEGGALVSGGEGQRVRLGRALQRVGARLVILDEPFRGLDRERRSALLQCARALWRNATLICITHDISETLEFPRVLVVKGGCVVEDAPPRELLEREGSTYRGLFEMEVRTRETLWGSERWRKLYMANGRFQERQRTSQ
jgi:ABC-type bacteriocin/lantibiotic exporter with double-glycine peptidase domain